MYEVDLHLHTYYSDGKYSPAEVVRKAKANGVKKLAITDHDGVKGIPEAREEASAKGIEFVTGVEFSTEYDGGINLHILGHGFDENHPDILETCEKTMKARRKRNLKLIRALRNMGYDITMDEIYQGIRTEYVGKPNIAALLLKKGYIKSYNEAFDDIYERNPIKVIRKEVMTTETAINIIISAGGKATLAHPGKTKDIALRGSENFFAKMEIIVKRLSARGLGGLECCHKSHSEDEQERFIRMARKYNLEATSGSDFHE